MIKIDRGAIGFTSGFSRGHKYSKVGEQITVEQLTELSIVMRISRHDHVYRHHASGSPGLGVLRTAGLSPLAGLLDYVDTRLKTSSRVRMGLYLAWKAS